LTRGLVLLAMLLALGCGACGTVSQPPANGSQLLGVAAESFLADIARNIAGDRIAFTSLIPAGMDPHAFEPVPSDIVKVSQSRILIENGAGLESWLQPILDNANGQRLIVDASAGLTGRPPSPGETSQEKSATGIDPHFWLDPRLVINYVKNIRDGLIQVDPAGASSYNSRADAYIAQLEDLDRWIQSRVAEIPPEKRRLVTNHETLGYFADRYGFTVIGSIIPGTSTGISPTARDIAALEEKIKSTGSGAIFIESGSNLDLATQIARETGVKVVTGLFTHSLSDVNGSAPTYIDMMRNNVNLIVNALKGK
jgi:ABC-type Zn uptake system ZnuABC Zn-binding protein ZnuA